MKIVFLGTSGSMPTKNRNVNAIALKFEGFRALFDCSEGTQRQLMKANFKLMQLNAIFISHFHPDHFLGLPGLFATMSLNERKMPLQIFGPKGIEQIVSDARKMVKKTLDIGFEIKVKEIKKGKIFEEKNFFIEAFELNHTVKCFGFCFKEKDKTATFERKKAEKLGIPVGPLYAKLQSGKKVKVKGKTFTPEQVMNYSKGRKGRKVCIALDTAPGNYLKNLKNCDVLIHEATFLETEKQKAKEAKHSTVLQAAAIAKKVKPKKLFLTHISPRYKNDKNIEKEALKKFKKAVIAKDLMKIKIEKNPPGKIK